jgi:hypothetical protein
MNNSEAIFVRHLHFYLINHMDNFHEKYFMVCTLRNWRANVRLEQMHTAMWLELCILQVRYSVLQRASGFLLLFVRFSSLSR